MNALPFVFTLLFLQVSASFFDKFQGAISNVNRGFGKLLSDIVTDVSDTVHSTISAVNEVLGLKGIPNKDSTSNHKRKVEEKPKTLSNIENRNHRSFDYNNLRHPINRDEYSSKHISQEIENHFKNVEKTKSDVLLKNANIESVEESFKGDTDRLEEISKVLRRELNNISSNVKNEMRNYYSDANEISVQSILGQIKTLDEVQRKSTNITEKNEINHILDKFLKELHLKEKGKERLDSQELNNMKKELQKLSNKWSEPQLKDKSFHLDTLKVIPKGTNKMNNTITPKSVKETLHNRFDHKDIIFKKHIPSQTHENLVKAIKKDIHEDNSVFSLDLGQSDYLTPFSNTAPVTKADMDSAKKLIEDSQHTDKVLSDFFKKPHESADLFSNPDLFDFGKR